MRRKSVADQPCPVARCLERVGEWWNILIIRDALHGLSRFDQFQRSLGVAPNTLARRLRALVDAGMLERRRYQERPPRHEYLLTERGREFRTVLMALHAFGNRHYTPDGLSVALVDRLTGLVVEPVVVDARTGRPLEGPDFVFVAGPAADDSVKRRLAFVARRSPVFAAAAESPDGPAAVPSVLARARSSERESSAGAASGRTSAVRRGRSRRQD